MGTICRRAFLLGVLVLCFSNYGQSAFERQRIQVLPWNPGGTGITNAFVYNPTRLANITGYGVAFGYTRMFNQKALQSGYLYSGIPMSFGTVGLGVDFFGNEQYLESEYMAGIARSWNDNGSFGLLVRIFSLDIRNYGRANAFAVDMGTTWWITQTLAWELAYGNITHSAIGRSKEPLPQQIFSAVEYHPIENLNTKFAVIHDLRYPVRYAAGVGYAPIPLLEFAIMLSTEPVQAQLGTIISWKLIHVQYTVTTHPVLPVTHRFGLVLGF